MYAAIRQGKAKAGMAEELARRQQVTIPPSRTLAVATRDGIVVPRVIADAGDQAARRFLEFFAATFFSFDVRANGVRNRANLLDHRSPGQRLLQ